MVIQTNLFFIMAQFFDVTGTWHDYRGVRHNFSIETDTAERRLIKQIVEEQYPTERVVVYTIRPQ